MILIEIEMCDYQTFAAIRKELRSKAAWGLLSVDYLPEDQVAYFYFWDTKYVPEKLMPYRIDTPPGKKYDFSGIRLPGRSIT